MGYGLNNPWMSQATSAANALALMNGQVATAQQARWTNTTAATHTAQVSVAQAMQTYAVQAAIWRRDQAVAQAQQSVEKINGLRGRRDATAE